MFHKRLLHEFKENKKNVFGMVLTQWLMLMANVMLLFHTALFISQIVGGEELIESGISLLVMLFFVVFIRCCMSMVNGKVSFKTSEQVKTKLRDMIYEKLMEMGSGYKKYVKTSEVVQLSTEGVEQLEIYFGKYIPQFFYSMLAPITLFVIVGSMSLRVALVLLICVPLIPISIVAVQKFAKKMLAKYWGIYTDMGDSFLECLHGLTTLKIYQADEIYAGKMDEEAEKFRKVTMRVLIMQLNSISVMDIIAYGGASIGIILSILEYQNSNINLVQCFFIIMISSEFFLPLRLLGSFFHIAMNGNAAADKIFRLLDLQESTKIINDNRDNSKKTDINSDRISFQHISFCYEKEKQVLFDICFQVSHGLNAIVGESGCGKSTIASLIMGDITADCGCIWVARTKKDEICIESLRRKITRISHDSYVFAGTIRENLLMGKEDATNEQMLDVLDKVNLLDFIKEKGGLEYTLLEKGANLSGGQKQRLALARALLHNSDIYIFDEATSNIDAESENDIMAVVRKLAETKIVVLISHRLANVVLANQILVMKNGKMIENGNHQSLYSKDGYYHKLFHQQIKLEQFGKEAEFFVS